MSFARNSELSLPTITIIDFDQHSPQRNQSRQIKVFKNAADISIVARNCPVLTAKVSH